MAKQHEDQIEECKSVFPTWQWLVGIISGAIVITATCALVYATRETTQDLTIKDHESRLVKVEVISRDLDTIKTLLRK